MVPYALVATTKLYVSTRMSFVYCSEDTPFTPVLLALTAADGPDCLPTALATASIAIVGNLAPTQGFREISCFESMDFKPCGMHCANPVFYLLILFISNRIHLVYSFSAEGPEKVCFVQAFQSNVTWAWVLIYCCYSTGWRIMEWERAEPLRSTSWHFAGRGDGCSRPTSQTVPLWKGSMASYHCQGLTWSCFQVWLTIVGLSILKQCHFNLLYFCEAPLHKVWARPMEKLFCFYLKRTGCSFLSERFF